MLGLGMPKDYNEMLNRISLFTFVGLLGATILIGVDSPGAGAFLGMGTIKVDIAGVQGIPLLYVVPPAVLTLLFRVFTLHNRVSTIFGIRQDFDLYEILVPLCGGVGIPVDLVKLGQLKVKRRELMQDAFYKYVGTENFKISSHTIMTTLDRWGWFWVAAELEAVGVLAMVALLWLGAFKSAAWIACVVIALSWVVPQARRACAPLTHAEIREILADPARFAEVKATLQ